MSSPYSFPNGFFGGMNISVSPDQIAANQSPDMSDCNFDGGGVPTKRYGLKRINESLGPSPIRHMVEFALSDDESEFLIVHGGNLLKMIER